MFMLPLFALLRRIAEPTPFLPPFFPPPQISLFWRTSIAIILSGTQKVFPTPVGRKHSIGSSSLTSSLKDSDIPTLFHRSSGSRSSPDISFALFSFVLSRSWEVFQNLGCNHLPILLAVLLSPVFHPNERLPPLNFQKSRWDDFAVYFVSHCPSAEEYSSLSSAAVLFTSPTLNALLMIWCSGQTALILSFLATAALTVVLRPLFFFSRPSMFKFFRSSLRHCSRSLLVSAAPTSLPLLFSSYLTLALSLHPVLSSIFPFTLIYGRNCFLSIPVLSGYNRSPDTHFSRETTRLMSWQDGERYLHPQQSLVVSFLLSLISTLVFSRTGGILSHLNSSTHTSSLDFHRGTCALSSCSLCSLSRFNGHSLLLSSYLSRIGRIENPFCSACKHPFYDTIHLILHCPATDSLRLFLYALVSFFSSTLKRIRQCYFAIQTIKFLYVV